VSNLTRRDQISVRAEGIRIAGPAGESTRIVGGERRAGVGG